MEKKKETLKEQVKRIVTPIFEGVASEVLPNSMATRENTFKLFFRPNNYRRKTEIKLISSSMREKVKSAIKCYPIKEFSINQHNKLIFLKNYMGVTIQLGKNTLTGIYSQRMIEGQKEIFMIHGDSLDHIEDRINKKKEDIKKKIDKAIFTFCKEFKLTLLDDNIIWDRYEDFIKGEEYIDQISPSTIVHDTFFKKVYGKGIEFKQTDKKEEPTAHLKNYIKNRAIENVSPEIANELAATREMVKGVIDMHVSFNKSFFPVFVDHAENIKTHNAVLKGIKRQSEINNKIMSKFLEKITNKQTRLGDF